MKKNSKFATGKTLIAKERFMKLCLKKKCSSGLINALALIGFGRIFAERDEII
jgi:hypothetical protein